MKSIQKIIPIILVFLLLIQFCGAQAHRNKKPSSKNKQPTTTTDTQTSDIVVPTKCPCSFPVLVFDGDKATLTEMAKNILKATAETIKQNPGSIIMINATALSTKSGQNKCNQKLQQVKVYLAEVQGVRVDRIVTDCQFTDDISATQTVLLSCQKN